MLNAFSNATNRCLLLAGKTKPIVFFFNILLCFVVVFVVVVAILLTMETHACNECPTN